MNRLSSRLMLVFTLSVYAGVASQCALVEDRERLQECKFSVAGLEIQSLSLASVKFLLRLKAENPNEKQVVVDRMDFKLFVEEKELAEGEHKSGIVIPPGATEVLKIDFRTSLSQLGSGLLSGLQRGSGLKYRMQGKAYLDTWLGEVAYPVLLEGRLDGEEESEESEATDEAAHARLI